MTKYSTILILVYKFYSEIYFASKFSIHMSKDGFSQFIRDINLEERIIDRSSNDNNAKFDKSKTISFSNISSFFNRFSSDYPNNKHIDYQSFFLVLLCISALHTSNQYLSNDKAKFIEEFLTSNSIDSTNETNISVY